MKRKVLYLTYDGLSDPLGSSQILPYLTALQVHGFEFTVISFEKESRFNQEQEQIQQQLDKANIEWLPRKFGNKIPLFSKLTDLLEFKAVAHRISLSRLFDFSLCRSYVSAQVGLYLKDKINLPFVFDTRGFWVDERIDKGIWNPTNPIYQLLLSYYKRKEKRLYREAVHIITLTEQAKIIAAEKWRIDPEKFTVIPCSTNSKSFTPITKENKKHAKEKLGIPEDSLSIGYLGSLGGWYDLDGMMLFFERIIEHYPDAHFIFLTPEPARLVNTTADKHGLNRKRFHVRFVRRIELNEAMDAFDLSIFFIHNCFSATACSPTRLAELWAKGIPVIANKGTGDLEQLFVKEITGELINSPFEEKFNFDKTIIEEYLALDPIDLRKYSHGIFDLKKAVIKYKEVLSKV